MFYFISVLLFVSCNKARCFSGMFVNSGFCDWLILPHLHRQSKVGAKLLEQKKVTKLQIQESITKTRDVCERAHDSRETLRILATSEWLKCTSLSVEQRGRCVEQPEFGGLLHVQVSGKIVISTRFSRFTIRHSRVAGGFISKFT